ncbi:uncharacterized protein LOC131857575 [Cryptomeria japonica]|uniref:uncharacterized protein LOC131857575 n=1 Tax=Cryptomeria japonica TaxID=3369 RepID=UPI0027DA3814|nr:uncharacterized protein LOC131857575 [Cryptomeria japonica]
MQHFVDSEEEMSDSAFSEEEESDSDSSSDTEDNFDDSEYESGKKRKYRKTRPSSSKGKKPQSKPLISISSEGEDSDDFEKENPKGLLKKKTQIHTQTRKKHKKKEETGEEPEVDKQARTLEVEHSLEKETMEETLRAADTISALHIPKEEQVTPGKAAPSFGPPPEEFKDDLKLYVYPNLNYIGIELWQVKSGTFFDNILVSDDLEYAKKLAEEIRGKKKDSQETGSHRYYTRIRALREGEQSFNRQLDTMGERHTGSPTRGHKAEDEETREFFRTMATGQQQVA